MKSSGHGDIDDSNGNNNSSNNARERKCVGGSSRSRWRRRRKKNISLTNRYLCIRADLEIERVIQIDCAVNNSLKSQKIIFLCCDAACFWTLIDSLNCFSCATWTRKNEEKKHIIYNKREKNLTPIERHYINNNIVELKRSNGEIVYLCSLPLCSELFFKAHIFQAQKLIYYEINSILCLNLRWLINLRGPAKKNISRDQKKNIFANRIMTFANIFSLPHSHTPSPRLHAINLPCNLSQRGWEKRETVKNLWAQFLHNDLTMKHSSPFRRHQKKSR